MTDTPNRWSPDARPVDDLNVAESSSATTVQARPKSSGAAQGLELNAILGPGTSFQGSLSFSGRVRIDGEFEGTARGGELLVVGDGARIRGEVLARKVIILGGTVNADITARESIEIYLPAVVTGDLKSPQIYMDRGIQFHGTCDMTADPPPVEQRPQAHRPEPER